MKKGISLVFAGFASIALFGCVTTGEFDQMKSDIAKLYVENSELRKEISELKTRVDNLSSDLNTTVALKEGQLTLIAQTQDYVKELQILKGKFEESSYNNEKRFKELNDKITELQAKLTPSAPPVEKQEPVQPPKETLKDPKQLYDDAHIDIKNKNFTSAREKFQEIIKNDPDFELVPNAYFWIGETYYGEKNMKMLFFLMRSFLKDIQNMIRHQEHFLRKGWHF